MPLSRQEVDILIEKLRGKYRDCAKKYSPKWFNADSFEERLRMSLNNRMNLEGFIFAEIAAFEKLKEKYEKKKSAGTFSQKVDRIIEENTARIRKYPAISFHPRAGIEIVHFYGAISEFTLHALPVLRLIADDNGIKNRLNDLESALDSLATPRGSRPPKRIEDHSLLLSRRGAGELEIERDKNEYLKESAFVLHDIVTLCDELMERRDGQWEQPLRFDRLYCEGERKKRVVKRFSGHTGYGAILEIRDLAAGVIEDFRLQAFRRKGVPGHGAGAQR